MVLKSFAIATALAVAATTSAQAFEFTGGNVEGTVFYYTDGSYTGYVVTGSAVAELGNAWGLQVDIGHFGYDGGPAMSYGLGLQVFNQITPEWLVGGFVTYEDWTGSPYAKAGVQARMEKGPFSLDAIVAAEWDLDSPRPPYYLGAVSGGYTLGNGVTLIASVPFEQDGAIYPRVSALYGFDSGAYVEGGVGAYSYPGSPADPFVYVRFGMDFGSGAKAARGFYPSILTGF